MPIGMLLGGRRRTMSKKLGRSRRLKGGHSPSPLNPANYPDGENMSNLAGNFAKAPNVFPSNQVGGMGYGYSASTDVSKFAGSYIPVTKVCTGGEFDLSRGGNNLMAGGDGRSRGVSRAGGSRRWRQKGCKKGGKKRSGSKSKKRSGGKSKKRSRSRKQRGGLIML